jgi:tRNA-specific 2-thiouridylase
MADMLDFTQPILMAARDASKDQSYFLSGVAADAFRNVLFPLGDLHKLPSKQGINYHSNVDENLPSVREIATQAKLPTAHKRDSMGICFIGKRRHADFVNEYIPSPSSSSTDRSQGRCINIEDGSTVTMFDPSKDLSLVYATIGQGARLSGAAQKWFVVDKPDPSRIFLCPGTHHPSLYSDSFFVQDINWIQASPPTFPFKAQCRIRHLQPLVKCEIIRDPEGGYRVLLETPFRGIAAGQVCGIYLNLVCMGGGAIIKRGPTYLELQKELPSFLHPSGHNDLSALKKSR